MAASRQGLPGDLLAQRMSEAQEYLASLNEQDLQYEAKRMLAESRMANLEQAQGGRTGPSETQWIREESLKSLQDSEASTIAAELPERPYASDGRQHPSHAISEYRLEHPAALESHIASDSILAGQEPLILAPSWNPPNANEDNTASATPSGSRDDGWPSSASVSSPDSSMAPPQKRPRDQTDSSPGHPGDRRKMQRSTYNTSAVDMTSPESNGSLDLLDDIPEELFALFGGDPRTAARELRESRLEQEAHDRMIAERREQEKGDEEFALALQQEDTIGFGDLSSQAGPSRQPANQTYFDPSGLYQAPQLPPSSSPATVISDPFNVPSNLQSPTSNIRLPAPLRPFIKSEHSANPSRQQPHSLDPQNDFIYLDSDGTSPEILMSSPNQQLSSNNNLLWGDAQSWQQANAQTSYDTNPAAYVSGSLDINGNTFQGMYNDVSGFVGQATAGQANGAGGSVVYNNNPLSNVYPSVIDLGSDDEASPYGNYLGPGALPTRNSSTLPLQDGFRDYADYSQPDRTKTKEEIKELLENIRPDEDLTPSAREGTPEGMAFILMEHQKLGLAWLKRMEEGTNKGGILADEMGLGKTVQAIALMAARRSSNPQRKTTLIIAPVALLKQWQREVQVAMKPEKKNRLTTFIFHGNTRNASWQLLRTYDVVLTTYGTLATEYKRLDNINVQKRGNPNWKPTSKSDTLSLLGDDCYWYRVILDEAQCIKNKSAQAARGACRLRAETRFCMTGTPMMNNVGELFSLIRFLRIKPYCEEKVFSQDIANPLRGTSSNMQQRAMKQLQALLRSLLLRRTKKSEIDGRPILNLPQRITEQQHVVFSDDEANFYRSLESRTQLVINKYLRAGTIGRHYSNVLVLLLRLRQACCHPHLIKDFGQSGSALDLSPEEMIELAKELGPDVVSRIKQVAAENEFQSLECPVCMDAADNPTIFIPCGHDTCSECFSRISDPSSAIAEGNGGDRMTDVKCPSCRGKIDAKRVIDFKTFKKVHVPEEAPDEVDDDANEADAGDVTTEDSDDSTNDSDEDEEEMEQDLKDFIVDDDVEDSSAEESETDDELDVKPPLKKNPVTQLKTTKKKQKAKHKGKGKAKEKKEPAKSFAQLKKEAGVGSRARKRFLKKLEKEWISSAKIEGTMDVLRDIQSRPDPLTGVPDKTIVFSQFTSLLDLVEIPLNREGWKYHRYDGSMTRKDRDDAVVEFIDDPSCTIMLVSLKAGNAGLNLTAANQVIMLDPFWNPYIEEQAIDRAHRIGQQKDVIVHRMLIQNTVEDRILALQEQKRQLIESALDENEARNIGRLGVRELAFLFVS